jgi:nitroimidazol reductase NimA-like FMN-containing flavoprotein (pyridoxamine 5'-phosphate oxidase superfamily)
MSNPSFEQNPRNQVRRLAKRGQYDKETVYSILDDGFMCHLSFVIDGQPFIIPTLYGREGDVIYIHGSHISRMLKHLETGEKLCLSVAHVDGIVLARSLFHHSINYRSAVVFGTGKLVHDNDEKMNALKVISDNLLKSRWEDARLPNHKEMAVTSVIRIEIEDASAKTRSGMPADDKPDYDLPVWAGVLPVHQHFGTPIPDDALPSTIPIPDYM